MKETGKTISNMGKEFSIGQMEETTKVTFFWENETELASTNGLMAGCTRARGKMENKTDEGSLPLEKTT